MKFSEFFAQVQLHDVRLQFDYATGAPPQRLSNEAMFHLPLIAMTILMLSKGRMKPSVEEIGQTIGDCFEQTFPGFRGSAQHLGWSASLRVRTVQALSFLELATLVSVESPNKKIAATALGRRVVDLALSHGGDLAHNLVLIERNHRNIRVGRQLRLLPR